MAAADETPKSKRRLQPNFDVVFPSLYGLGFAALGICLQLVFFPIGDLDLESDFYGDLVIAARKLAEGQFSVHNFAWKGPVYAFVLVLVRGVAGDWYRGAVVLSAVAGGAYLVLAYRLVLRLFDRRTAVATTIVASLVVEFFVQFHRASTDVLFLLLSVSSACSVLLAGGSRRRLAAAGGLAALAFLTRYNGAFLVGGTALVLLVVNPDRLAPRGRLEALALYLAVFLLICTPWFVTNWVETGRVLATRNVENIVTTFYGGSRWLDDPAAKAGNVTRLITAQPVSFVAHFARNLVNHPWKDLDVLLGWPLALLPILGILGLVVRPPTRRQVAWYVFAVTYWLLMGIVFYTPRFSLPMILPYVAVGFAAFRGDSGEVARRRGLARLLLDGRARGRVTRGALAAFVVALVVVQVQRVVAGERSIHGRRPLYLLEAGRTLARQHRPQRPRILARKGHIAYYANADFSPYSQQVGSLEELVRYAKSERAEYIVYSSVEYSLLPRMLFLAVSDTVPLLDEVYRAPNIRIFRLEGGAKTTLTGAERRQLMLANLRGAREQRRPAAIYIALLDLASQAMQEQQFEDAAARYAEALAVAERSNGGPEMARAAAIARHDLAWTQLARGHPELALPLLQQNLDYFASQGSQSDVARTYETLARAHEMMGRTDEALEERRRARELRPEGDDAARRDSLGTGLVPK